MRPLGTRRRPAAAMLAVALICGACSARAFHEGGSTTTTSRGAGSSTVSASGHVAPVSAHLVWRPCGKFRCATLVVPVSYADPAEGTLRLAVIELPATRGAAHTPDLVLNPGGPGESGLQFLENDASEFPAALRSSFNLVSFDPRGVGESDPVVCTSPSGLRKWLALDPAPATPGAISTLISEVKAFDKGCARHTPKAVLANLSTAVTAHDMDRLRAALGESKLDYLGFSYGTYLGALYAEAFPDKVGNMVLDGAVDPALGTATLDREQAQAFETDLHDFFAWCPTNAGCAAQLPKGARATYREVIGHLLSGATLTADLSAPLGGVQQVNYAVTLKGVILSLSSTTYWSYLAQALSEAMSGNGTLFAELADSYVGFNPNGTASNLVSAETAISCLDRPAPAVSSYPSLARRLAVVAPDFGAAEAWGSLACNFWPVAASGRAAPVHLRQPLPILVVGSTHDPATPYAWALALTHQLAGAELLSRTGDGHTGYFSSTCVQKWVDSYLASGVRPPAGTVCASDLDS
jgi:pimeloyl-ACP methyl ester carboxylesterase